MGAHHDSVLVVHKNLADGFAAASEQARWEDGNDPYSGSIGQKGRAVEVGTLPARWTLDEFRALVLAAELEDYEDYCNKHNDWDTCSNANPFKDAPKRQTTPQVIAMAKKFASIRDDKWSGTAAAVKLNDNQTRSVKERRGRKGTRDGVWFVEGLCAS